MPRTSILFPLITVSAPHLREDAAGMQTVWACALHAAGADVFAPIEPLEPGVDPFVAFRGKKGAALFHDRRFPKRIDAVVLAELNVGTQGWRCRARIRRRDGSETLLAGRPSPRRTAPLEVLTSMLHALARAFGLEMPEEFGWRELLSACTIAEGLANLSAQGRETLQHAEPQLPALMN